ncbi:TonB-dependent receptor [Aquimarina hainanensis]|uniref:TonB-dependent receptor n=1 Tax=Aquimarina hainanensis TaxID=1578017 RepID=A0ABW5N8F7_9FLAO
MIKNIHKIIALVGIGLMSSVGMAQEKEEETIGTERVVIVKAYTPTISDAFKIKSIPSVKDSVTQQKKELNYSIFSVPVASTFTPVKGKAAAIEKPKQAKLYDNYATLGFGNYTSVLAEFYSNFQLNRSDNMGVYLHHNSSQGGIDDLVLDDKFYNTFLDLNYTSRTRDVVYGIEAGGEHKLINWYGLPANSILTTAQIDGIEEQQSYYGVKIGAQLEIEDAMLKKGQLEYRFFGDAFNTSEHRLQIKPTFEFEVADEVITTKVIADYLGGSFERNRGSLSQIPNEYSVFNIGVAPSLIILRDHLSVQLGASVFYSMDIENSDNDFFIYPNITASYRVLEDAVIAYGGIEGGLSQNSYRDAVIKNPFVSPTLFLSPTSNQFDGYIGLKGKLSDMVTYNFRGSYISEMDKALLVNNPRTTLLLEGYDYGNSFSYRYDDMKTIKALGEIGFAISNRFKLGASVTYFNYSMDREQEAWNLPEIESSLTMDYQITDQWSFGAQVFYVGERKELDHATLTIPSVAQSVVELDSFIDANINIGYRFNDRLSVFAKGNNLLGETYEKWINYPVQGIQVLGGATYKFDF